MRLLKIVSKILIISAVASVVAGGCGGGPEEVPAEPSGGAPSGEAPSGGAPAGGGAPPANGSSNASPMPPGDVPKTQETPEKP